MKRSLLALNITLALAGAGSGAAVAQGADAPPSTPAGLAANPYDTTSGGIRWQRSSDDRGAVRGYEVARDGTVVGVFDALSYVDRSLRPGMTYTYRVTAIDNAGQRSGPSATQLRTPGGTGGSGAPGAPAAPSGLRATVYSATAGALSWTRSATVGLRHEVRRDGRVLATTDGTSYVDRALSGARAYAYEVIAIDRQGRRSVPAAVTVRTVGGTGTPPSATLAAVSGLRSSVYSATAAGIAWTRSPAPVVRYEVSRDAQVLATTDGTSYVDDTLVGGRTYTYSIVALDAGGRRASPATVMLDTPLAAGATGGPGNPALPPVTPPPGLGVLPAAVQSRLESVFYIANGEDLERVVALGRRLQGIATDGTTAGFDQVRVAGNGNGTTSTTLSCPDGGRFDVVIDSRDGVATSPFYIGRSCRIGLIRFDGVLRDLALPTSPAGGLSSPIIVRAENLTLTDDRVGTTLFVNQGIADAPTTQVGLGERLGYDALTLTPRRVGEVAASSGGDLRNYTVIGAASTRVYPPLDDGDTSIDSLLAIDFNARLDADGSTTAVFSEDLFGGIDERGNFTSGRLRVLGVGFEYLLDARNGDPVTFQLDVTENGSTTSYTVPWSSALRFDAFEPGKVDPGF